jgi:hypothetical protein
MKIFFIAVMLFITSFLVTSLIIFVFRSFEAGKNIGRSEYRNQYFEALQKMYPECKKDGGYLVAAPFHGGSMLIGCAHFRSVDRGMKMSDHEFVIYEGQI